MITIYKILNNLNSNVYIGQTSLSIEERFAIHLKHMREGRDSPLYKDMKKHGIENFKIEKIDKCAERHKFIIERYWINYYFDEGTPVYNLVGKREPVSTLQKMSEARLSNSFDYNSEAFKRKMSEATSGERNGMYGKKGDKAINGRMVLALSADGEIKHQFSSVGQALSFIGVKGHIGLNNAAKSGELYKGYYWKKEWIDR